MKGDFSINGKDAYSTWGITLSEGAIAALLTPAGKKDYIQNSSRMENGIRYIDNLNRWKERTVDLPFNLTASTPEIFISRYKSFCEELMKGRLELRIKILPGMIFRFIYKSCTQFAELRCGIAKFSLNLIEPDPSNRK